MRKARGADKLEPAKLERGSRARVPQILDLLHLASDIPEAILFMPPVKNGCELVTEWDLRRIESESVSEAEAD